MLIFVHERYQSIFFFPCNDCIWFQYQGNNWPYRMRLEMFPSSLFSKRVVKSWYYLNVWWDSPVEPSRSRLFFVGKFLNINSISLIDTELVQFSLSSWDDFDNFVFQRINTVNLIDHNFSTTTFLWSMDSVEMAYSYFWFWWFFFSWSV